MLIYEKKSLSVYGDKEDIKYDAEKMSSFNEQLDSDYEWFKDRARILEGNYIKYCNNETFVGDAADASKKFIMDGQCGELHAKNILIKKEFVETCFDIEELFKGMVDSSPHARISTKVLLKIKKDFGVYYALIDTKGFEIERRTSRLVNDYSKWGITTIPNYNKPYVVLEAFCDNGGFLDECIRKLEDFDRDAYNYINGKDFITRAEALKTKINNTAGALGSMTVYQPNMKKQSVSLVALSSNTQEDNFLYCLGSTPANQDTENELEISHVMVEKYSSKWDIELGDAAWTTADIVYWKTFGGNDFLFKKKTEYLKKYSNVIKDAAQKYKIPEKLLAGIVFNEYGGDPLWIDDVAYGIRKYDWSGNEETDSLTITKKPEQTSFGNLSLQVRRVAEMYGYDPNELSPEQEKEIINDLKDPVKSTYVAAAHLRDLKNVDYAEVASCDMDDNMIRDVATRYNRGPDIPLDKIHQNTSYGNTIFKHEKEIESALED
ncbi:hypothetical protein [Butyrivibrio sp. INlla21]|uniref:hypothetical protein n=1 Tax=Butyrivibrio sp. INlla21 TaxID=1520811 RepID=UPI0008E8C2C9|nr:hypothetical protein [Butyrivibrio sp. INlla21]SFU49025.1 hypothetical protein SAMN02910342_00690 [Butyrivibrio sp. INlla21]